MTFSVRSIEDTKEWAGVSEWAEVDGCTEAVRRSEQQVEVVRWADRRVDISDGRGGVGRRLIGCGEVGRNRQVSGNGGMGRSGRVIGGAGTSGCTSEQTIGHNARTQRGAGRSGQTQRGETFSLGSHCKTSSSLLCVNYGWLNTKMMTTWHNGLRPVGPRQGESGN